MSSFDVFDAASKDIIVVNYPPGGHGNFIFHILTEFALETAKPGNHGFDFSKTGNSHATIKYTIPFQHESKTYVPLIRNSVEYQGKKIVVLSDNGIENSNITAIRQVFPNAQIVRSCIDNAAKVMFFYLLMEKVCGDNISVPESDIIKHWQTIPVTKQIDQWGEIDDPNTVNLSLTSLVTNPVDAFTNLFKELNLTLIHLDELKILCDKWSLIHSKYANLIR